MRRISAIATATAFEIISEPFVLLVLIAALALAVLAPAMHYHQFGEPTRMARDAAISSLLVGGAIVAIFATVKSWRREIESGTAMLALALGVSRREFFVAKTLGAAAALAAFSLAVGAVGLAMINGSAIGSATSTSAGMLERVWGPSLALSLSAIVLPPIIAALLNRFGSFRFVATANCLVVVFALAAASYRFDFALAVRLLPVLVLAALPSAVLLTFASAFACMFKLNQAVALSAAVALLALPFLGNYCLSDAVAYESRVSSLLFWLDIVALMPFLAVALIIGMVGAKRRL